MDREKGTERLVQEWVQVLQEHQPALLQGEGGWQRPFPRPEEEEEERGEDFFEVLLGKQPEERVPRLARLEYLGLDMVKEIREAGPPRPLLFRMDLLVPLVRLLSEGHSVALVGDPSVGKKGLLWQLAYAIVHAGADFPSTLAERPVILVHASVFHEGVFYMHELENRLRAIIRNALKARAILAVDQVSLLARAGAYDLNVERTIANLLLPGLQQGLTLIGVTTPEGFRYLRQQAPAFAQALIPLEVPPMDRKETLRVLKAVCRAWKDEGLEVDSNVAEGALSAAAFVSEPAPGGPLRLLRVARALSKETQRLRRETLDHALASYTGLPFAVVSRSQRLTFEEIYGFFSRTIYGQEEAIAAVADAILGLKTRLNRPDGPWGVFLFLGPSGVGKTELARQTARFLFGSEKRLIRCDMGAYIGPEGLRRFLGDPTGLRHSPVEVVAAQPFSVLLLDEVEKSDRYLFDALLSILGEGRIADAQGRTVSFRHCLIIMTSNVGSELFVQMQRAGSLMPVRMDMQDMESRIRRELERYFRPEFINRIHRVVIFRPLSPEVVRRIAEREIRALEARLAAGYPGVSLEVSPAIVERCAAEGYDPALGARPMQRAVARWVQVPLARFLAAHPEVTRGRIRIDLSPEGCPYVRLEDAKIGYICPLAVVR